LMHLFFLLWMREENGKWTNPLRLN
jgi:hypothetical protein